MFDRFFTADRAHTAGKGTGLGLSICKRIMEFHGQSLRLLDTAEGTAFAFTLEKAEKRGIHGSKNKGKKTMRELRELRQELDGIDRELVHLFEKRMGVALEVAQYKAAHGLPVLDASRGGAGAAKPGGHAERFGPSGGCACAVCADHGAEPRCAGAMDEGGGRP